MTHQLKLFCNHHHLGQARQIGGFHGLPRPLLLLYSRVRDLCFDVCFFLLISRSNIPTGQICYYPFHFLRHLRPKKLRHVICGDDKRITADTSGTYIPYVGGCASLPFCMIRLWNRFQTRDISSKLALTDWQIQIYNPSSRYQSLPRNRIQNVPPPSSLAALFTIAPPYLPIWDADILIHHHCPEALTTNANIRRGLRRK